MPENKDARERSVSGGYDDSDFESHAGDTSNPPGKPGRKKNPNSQAARRDQNRIAQREFRLRKQQRIRDLEARVELLSGGKDEALGEMRNMLKDLMAENQTLRNLLRSVAGFIGEGAGGLLPKLGWDLSDFNNYINKSETDTAWEGYQRRKKAPQSESGPSSQPVPISQGQKRASEEAPSNSRSKKQRSGEEKDSDASQNGYSMLAPMNPSAQLSATNNMYSQGSRSQERSGMFSELMRGTSGGSPMFMHSPSTTSSPQQYPNLSSSNIEGYPPSYMPGMNMNIEASLPPISFDSPNSGTVSTQQQAVAQPTNALSPDEVEDDNDPNKNEAYKLIHYHLDNYKRNTAYCLPSSLRPSLVQRTVPHESIIDRILHPELRDRMILLRGRYDLVDCLVDYRQAVTIHGDDVLAHSNWEIGDKFLRKYGFLIDQATLNISNRWRRERGEAELRLTDISTAEHTPAPA